MIDIALPNSNCVCLSPAHQNGIINLLIKRAFLDLMMVICPKAGPLAFTPPGDEMSEVVPVTFLTDNYGSATCPR